MGGADRKGNKGLVGGYRECVGFHKRLQGVSGVTISEWAVRRVEWAVTRGYNFIRGVWCRYKALQVMGGVTRVSEALTRVEWGGNDELQGMGGTVTRVNKGKVGSYKGR